jgi:hypothetical protein
MARMQATLNALAAFPAELEQHFAAFPPGYANWAPASWDGVPSEAFTAIEQVCHVRDIEIEGYQVRFRRTLEEDSPLRRPAVFEGYGRVTLRGLVHYLCSHDQQHLSGLQWLLGKIDAERA